MKKIYTFLAMAMVTMMTMTSCDADYEDRMEARTLEVLRPLGLDR